MQIREAILKAADSIEKHSELFNFSSTVIPDCGTPGCALGWIAFHRLEAQHSSGMTWIPDKPVEHSDLDFYRRMDGLQSNWKYNAVDCAKALRLYADKYHPATDHIPEDIRAIFNEQVASPAEQGQ